MLWRGLRYRSDGRDEKCGGTMGDLTTINGYLTMVNNGYLTKDKEQMVRKWVGKWL